MLKRFFNFLLNKVFSLLNMFFFFNLLLLVLFCIAIFQDHFREWKNYQKEYFVLEKDRIEKSKMIEKDPQILAMLDKEYEFIDSQRLKYRQIVVEPLDKIDRCITCHVAYDYLLDPKKENNYEKHPYSEKKNVIHDVHSVEKFGCTVCHSGQGLATNFIDAGHMPSDAIEKATWKQKYKWHVVDFWEHPMKKDSLVYSSCKQCHQNDVSNIPMDVESDIVVKGEKLVWNFGCIGCHQIKGEGNTIGPDLADTSEKPLGRIDFSYAIDHGLITEDERTVENWIRLHFSTHPSVVTPGDPQSHYGTEPIAPSAMPFFGFSSEEIESLVAYIESLRHVDIPSSYIVESQQEKEMKDKDFFDSDIQYGRYVFEKYGCGGCHGMQADAGISIYNYKGGVAPNLTQVVGLYSKKELSQKILYGVNPLMREDQDGLFPVIYMPSFKGKITIDELDVLIKYLFSIAVEEEEDW